MAPRPVKPRSPRPSQGLSNSTAPHRKLPTRASPEALINASSTRPPSYHLGAEAEDVQDVANGVVEVTDRHDGIVVDSQVTTDEDGARAAFELQIPYRELDATLTDLSSSAT